MCCGYDLLFFAFFPEMSGPIWLLFLSLQAFAANHDASSKKHIGNSRPEQFSKVKASPGANKQDSPLGAGVSQPLQLRGIEAGDLELPAPNVIPVAYFLYSNKVEFDKHSQKELFNDLQTPG